METIALANLKGGTGKTTTAVNLSAGLALLGKKTVLIDLDFRADSSHSFQIEKPEITIIDVLEGRESILNATYDSEIENLFVIPSSYELANLSVQLAAKKGYEKVLSKAIKPADKHIDYLIIDCPPSRDSLVINALVAAEHVMAVSQPEYWPMDGVKDLRNLLTSLSTKGEIDGVVLTNVSKNLIIHQEVTALFKEAFGAKLFKTVIRKNTDLTKAVVKQTPIQLFNAKSIGAKDYNNLAREVTKRWPTANHS